MQSMQKWINNSINLGRKKELASPMSEFFRIGDVLDYRFGTVESKSL